MRESDPENNEAREALACADGTCMAHSFDRDLCAGAILPLARALRFAWKKLSEQEVRCMKHEGHEHCVTPCDSIRIQDSNHSAWLEMKSRAEKSETDRDHWREQFQLLQIKHGMAIGLGEQFMLERNKLRAKRDAEFDAMVEALERIARPCNPKEAARIGRAALKLVREAK